MIATLPMPLHNQASRPDTSMTKSCQTQPLIYEKKVYLVQFLLDLMLNPGSPEKVKDKNAIPGCSLSSHPGGLLTFPKVQEIEPQSTVL